MSLERIKKGEGFFWVVVGVLICALAWQTGLGFLIKPGPGFIAFVAGFCMVGVGLAMIISAFNKRPPRVQDQNLGPKLSPVRWARILYTMGLLFAYAALLEPLGYVPTTLLILWGLFYDWDRNNWFLSLVTSMSITAASYILIEKLLGLPFPSGIFY